MITSSKYHGRETGMQDKVCIICTVEEIETLIFAMTLETIPSKQHSDFLDDLIKFKKEAFGR